MAFDLGVLVLLTNPFSLSSLSLSLSNLPLDPGFVGHVPDDSGCDDFLATFGITKIRAIVAHRVQ